MKKVVIIGAGNVGKSALDFLGAEFVECFADNGKKGRRLCGKKILSVEEAVKLNGNFILLLAMTNYVEELKNQLTCLNVDNFYYFREALYFFDGIKQWGKRTVYEKRSLWEMYKRYGLANAGIVGKRSEYASFIAELFGVDSVKADDQEPDDRKWVVNMPYGVGECEKNNLFVLPWMDHPDIRREHGQLAVFRGKYTGRRCFIIGNGPSLRIQDLDRLRAFGEICFGFNVIHKLYDRTEWRPDFVCVKDPLVMAQNYRCIKENNSGPVFISDVKYFYHWDSGENEYPFYDIQEHLYFSDDIVMGCSCGASVSYTAIQICAYMGFSEIYLLGMDCSNWQEHFDDDYWSEEEAFRAPDEVKIFHAYRIAEQYSKSHGFRIFNATRGGKLEVFERVGFDSLFMEEAGNESSGICPDQVKQPAASG